MLKLVIGSTVEGLKYAEALQELLIYDFEVTIWNQGIFAPGKSNLENLVDSVNKFDCAVFFFTCDDSVSSRNKEKNLLETICYLNTDYLWGLWEKIMFGSHMI